MDPINLNEYIKDERKCYSVCCTTAESWQYVHDILTQDGSIDDNIPSYPVEVVDIQDHSETRAVYLMTDAEADQLRNHPDIRFVEVNISSYPDLPRPPPEDIVTDRYSSTKKCYNNFQSPSYLPPLYQPTTADIARSGYQILRCNQYDSPWYGQNIQTVINSTVPHGSFPTGKNVDVVVGDDGCWFGHYEFRNNLSAAYKPIDYVGGNKLPGNGTCDLLDLVLEAPYYIDPAWFNASPGTRLTTRWDGTTVPVESVAKAWWTTASQRSSQFASVGTVAIPAGYTRAYCNGTDTAISLTGDHGTCCAGQTYGRTMGWAYNANKWFVNAIGNNGLWPVNLYFDVLKIFHQNKPINPLYGTKDPTVSSNSWGFRESKPSSGYYYFRQGTTGTGGVAFASSPVNTVPAFISTVGGVNDGRMKGEMVTGTLTVSGDEMVQSGVIFVAAAGNDSQKQVPSSNADYNNYWSTANNTTLANAKHLSLDGITYCYNTTNRRGFPQQLGMYTDGGNVVYPVINIGALDDNYSGTYNTTGKEQKVGYSDRGPEVDVYSPGDGSMAPNRRPTFGYTTIAPRRENVDYASSLTGTISCTSGNSTVTGVGTSFTTQLAGNTWLANSAGYTIGIVSSVTNNTTLVLNTGAFITGSGISAIYNRSASYDTGFSGTSSACPTAAGMIGVWLEVNRSWTWQNVRNNIQSLTEQLDAKFYQGPDPTTATSTAWSDYNSLVGGVRRVLYNNIIVSSQQFTITGNVTISNGLSLNFN